ncbi:hypothetical protein ACJJTC_010003 [Scirpophaga incertulas]
MCHVDLASSPSLKTYVRVIVIDPPQRLWVIQENGTRLATVAEGSNTSRNIGPYYVGDTVHLFCVSFGGRPQPTLSWWIEKRLLKETSMQLSEQRVRSDVMYGPLEREDHGMVLSCYATNNNKTKPISIDVTINMYLSPELISVRGASNDISASGRVRANEPVELQCRVLGARPPPSVHWKINDAHLTNLPQNITTETSQRLLVSEVQLTLGPEYDESHITCCAQMYSRSDNAKYLCAPPLPITVRYSPVVQIVVYQNLTNNTLAAVKGSNLEINCTYEANPRVDRLLWFHQDDLLLKYTSDDVTPILKLRNLSEAQAGEYACEASNEEGTTYSDPLVVDITYPAYCEDTTVTEYGLGEDEFLNITCNVKANPNVVTYRWLVVNDSVNVHTADMEDITQEMLETEEPVLLYQRPAGVPFSTVFCWGLNGVASSDLPHTPCVSLITDETAPRPPTDCEATRNAAKDIMVICKKGYDGGLPQKFKFAVVSSGKGKETIVTISNKEPKFLIQEPQEESYMFIIIAENEKGESDDVEIKKEDIINLIPDPEEPKSAVANITTLALALCGGVALVALAACGLVLCAHERGSRADLPHLTSDPPLCAYNTDESNCETYHSDDGSDCNVRRTESFRRAVSRYPSKNFDVRRTSSFHSARYMNDFAEHEPTSKYNTFRHSTNCRVHSLQNISKKRDMDALCDHLVMHLPPEANYVSRPMNTFHTMPRKMRHKLNKELSDETSEITQTSDGFSLPPPPDEYGTYRAATRIKDMPSKASPTYTTIKKNPPKDLPRNPTYISSISSSPMNTVGIPTISAAHNSVYNYEDDNQTAQVSTNPFGDDSS